MKLWHGWHNTSQDRPYFHYGPFGSTQKQMGNTGTNIKVLFNMAVRTYIIQALYQTVSMLVS